LTTFLVCLSIISVTTYSAILSSTNNPRGKIQPEGSGYSGWFWTLAKIVFFIGAVAGALYGYKTYTLRSAHNFNSYPRSPGIGGTGLGGGGFYEKRF
jgi:mannose-binding lectin 2